MSFCILGVFLGHLYPIYHGFKGGKGVATSLGIILAASPLLAGISLGIWGLTLRITRWVSLASILAALAAAIAAFYLLAVPSALALSAMALLLIAKHNSNIKRLQNGTEPKI